MSFHLDHIHIFKTNIVHLSDSDGLSLALNGHQQVDQWSVDCDDVDCVLRVVSGHLKPADIIGLVAQHGYHCEELE